jgi:hypothetical protein
LIGRPAKRSTSTANGSKKWFQKSLRVISELGYDIEEIDQEIAEDQKRADFFNFSFDSDVRHKQQK